MKEVARAAAMLARMSPVEYNMTLDLAQELRHGNGGGTDKPQAHPSPAMLKQAKASKPAKAKLPPGRKRAKRRTPEQMAADLAKHQAEVAARKLAREQARLAKSTEAPANLAPAPATAPGTTTLVIPNSTPSKKGKPAAADKTAAPSADPYEGEVVKTTSGESRPVS